MNLALALMIVGIVVAAFVSAVLGAVIVIIGLLLFLFGGPTRPYRTYR